MLELQCASGADTEAVQNKPQVCTSQCTQSTRPKLSKFGRVASERTNLNQKNVWISRFAVATPNGI